MKSPMLLNMPPVMLYLYYFDAEHINHFDCNALENLAGLHGFNVVDKGEKTIPASSAVDYPAVYVLLRKRLALDAYDEAKFGQRLESRIVNT